MEKLIIKETRNTPAVVMQDGLVELVGRSIPGYANKFYEPILNWIDKYSLDPAEETHVTISIDIFNTSSLKCIIDILVRFSHERFKDKIVIVDWFYETGDEDMLEIGMDLNSLISLPFSFKIMAA